MSSVVEPKLMSLKSSRKTKSATGVHCPGNKDAYDPKPDMSEIWEALRLETPPLLPGERWVEDVPAIEVRDADNGED